MSGGMVLVSYSMMWGALGGSGLAAWSGLIVTGSGGTTIGGGSGSYSGSCYILGSGLYLLLYHPHNWCIGSDGRFLQWRGRIPCWRWPWDILMPQSDFLTGFVSGLERFWCRRALVVSDTTCVSTSTYNILGNFVLEVNNSAVSETLCVLMSWGCRISGSNNWAFRGGYISLCHM